MSKEKKFMTFTEAAKKIEKYGKEISGNNLFEDFKTEDIHTGLLTNIQNSLCDLNIIITSVQKAIYLNIRESINDEANIILNEWVYGWLGDMEKEHGECPEGRQLLAEYWRSEWRSAACHEAEHGRGFEKYHAWRSWTLPEKGTKTRRAYDKWRRRKVK